MGVTHDPRVSICETGVSGPGFIRLTDPTVDPKRGRSFSAEFVRQMVCKDVCIFGPLKTKVQFLLPLPGGSHLKLHNLRRDCYGPSSRFGPRRVFLGPSPSFRSRPATHSPTVPPRTGMTQVGWVSGPTVHRLSPTINVRFRRDVCPCGGAVREFERLICFGRLRQLSVTSDSTRRFPTVLLPQRSQSSDS